MPTSEEGRELTPLSDKEQRERSSALSRGYIAFILALLFLELANGDKWPFAWLPETLFAISLPSLIAWELTRLQSSQRPETFV